MSTTSAISTAPSSSSSSYSSFNDLHSITFTIDLYHIFDSSFSTLSSALYPSPNTTDAKEFVLPANRLFFALRRYLWYHYYDATHHYLPNSSTSGYIIHINQEKSLLERSLHQNNQLWFPRLIQLENVKYSKDDFISFSNPSQGGGKKLYPVLCENHELVVALMNHLHNWVNNPLENGSSSTDTSRKEVFRRIDWLWKMSAFLQHIVERLKSLPISSSTAVMDSFFNFDAMKHLPDEFSDIAQLDSWHSLFTGLTTSLNGSLPCTRSIRYQIGRSAMFWVMCQHFLSVNGLDAIFDPSSLLFLSSQAVSKVFTNACVVQELFLSFQHTLYLKCQSKDEKCSSLIRELEEKTLSGIQLHLKDLIERVGDQCYLKERDLGVCVIESPRVLFIELLRDRLNPLLLPLPWNQFLQVLLQRSRDLRILFLQDCLQIEWKLMNQDGVVGYSVNTLLQLILLLEGLISACSEKETPAQTAVQLTVVIPELCRFPTITEFYSYKCKDVGITLMAKLPSDDDNHVIVALPKELKQSSTLPVLADFCSLWNAL